MVFALSTGACSTIDDLIGDETPAPASDAGGFPPDTAPPATTADSGGSPNLATVPDRPTGTTTADDQRAMADSLAADRSRIKYSSDALRGGTEAAAPPPGAAPPPETAVAASAPPPDNTPPPAPESAAPPPPAPPTAGAPPPDNTPPPPPRSAPVATAPMGPPPGTQPAVPPTTRIPGGARTMAMADGPLGFKPSSAPPLDPSISQFVPQPIITRYQQTAAAAGAATGPIAPVNGGAVAAAAPRRTRGGMGGPEAMSGAVVANLDAINGSAPTTPSVYANPAGLPPAAVVMFPGDGTALDAAGRAQVRAAVAAYQQRGGTGYVKVVGHSSSRTSNMPVEKHLVAIFAKSQARANSVARELIRQGVPASKVLVEAVGDSQPVYYESMPQGEAGNRRAEIFIQG
jgi:outer membrane protein OmpA-like peptidoglycan-associated protein